jgi:hypothetical protein
MICSTISLLESKIGGLISWELLSFIETGGLA